MKRACWAIYFTAVSVRLLLIFGFHRTDFNRSEPHRIAVNLAATRAFANPYSVPTGPTAHTGPLFPLLLAPFYYFWGNTRDADIARVAAGPFVGSIQYALLPMAADWIGLDAATGLLAGWAGALVPLHHYVESLNGFEAPLMSLFLILSLRFLKFPLAPWREGAFWGVAFLVSPTLLSPALALAAWRSRLGWNWKRLGVTALTALLVLLPWTLRNHARLGGWYPVRDDLGLELWVSNRDGAFANQIENIRSAGFLNGHPFSSAATARSVARTGEAEFEKDRMDAARVWILSHPRQFLRLTLERAFLFWFPWLEWKPLEYLLRLVTLAAFGGLALAWHEKRLAAAPITAVWVSFPLVYYAIETYIRYQHPLWWSLVLMASYAAVRAVSLLRSSRKPLPAQSR
jgi:hypothetical protein